MKTSAVVSSHPAAHVATVRSGEGDPRLIDLPGKPGGGSAVNGGELLALALATCYCNDLYREAAAMGLVLDAVEVTAVAEFAEIGRAAIDVRYRARVESAAPAAVVEDLLRRTDAVAEVHNTLRAGIAVTREPWPRG